MTPRIVSQGQRLLWLLGERLWLSRRPNEERLQARTPVFLLFTLRSGSKLLLDYFACLPGASFEHEILNPDFRWPRVLPWILGDQRMRFSSKEAALRYIANRLCRQKGDLCAVKISEGQFQRAGLTPGDLAAAFPTARFIILYRRSLGRQAVSWAIAVQTRQWGWRQGERTYRSFSGTVRLVPEWLEQFYATTRGFYESVLQDETVPARATVVCYEELAADPQATLQRTVFPLVGRSTERLQARQRQQAVRPLDEVVSNYREVEALLFGPAATQAYTL